MPPTYRYELAKTGRAGCQNSACKKEGIKIEKGELRFGSLVQIREHDTWMWKHWGCVTPAQIEKIVEQIGGLDGLDLDNDLDILDGYDELDSSAQLKIRDALKNGHVADDDWKGDPELNRPGMKGINKRSKKKKKDDAEGDQNSDTEAVPTPKPKKTSSKKTAVKSEDDNDLAPSSEGKKKVSKKRKAVEADDEDELALDEHKTKKKRAPKGAKNATTAIKDEDMDANELSAPAANSTKKTKAKKTTKSESKRLDSLVDEVDEKAKRSRKTRSKVKVEADPDDTANATGKKRAKSNKAKNNIKEEDNKDDVELDMDKDGGDLTIETKKPVKANRKPKIKDDPDALSTNSQANSGLKKKGRKPKA